MWHFVVSLYPCVRLSEFEAVKFSKFALSKKKKKRVDRIVLDIRLWRQTETFSDMKVINIDKPESFSKGGNKFTATVAKSKIKRSC